MNERLDAEIIKKLRSKIEKLRKKVKDHDVDLKWRDDKHEKLWKKYKELIDCRDQNCIGMRDRVITIEKERDDATGVAYELKERLNFLFGVITSAIIQDKYTPPPYVVEFLMQHLEIKLDTSFLSDNKAYDQTNVAGLLE
jgi:predicted nuclease with TOPRIM domain